MVQNAEIIIEKPSGAVPKNTAYQFPFQIIAPSYGEEAISRTVEIECEELSIGKIFDFYIYRDKFEPIKSVNITQLDKYLLHDGVLAWTIDDDNLVQLPISEPTTQDFLQYGFSENVFIGMLTKSVQMQQVGQTENGYIYEAKIPQLFDEITNIYK